MGGITKVGRIEAVRRLVPVRNEGGPGQVNSRGGRERLLPSGQALKVEPRGSI